MINEHKYEEINKKTNRKYNSPFSLLIILVNYLFVINSACHKRLRYFFNLKSAYHVKIMTFIQSRKHWSLFLALIIFNQHRGLTAMNMMNIAQ